MGEGGVFDPEEEDGDALHTGVVYPGFRCAGVFMGGGGDVA